MAFSLFMIVLALIGGFLMLWKIPLLSKASDLQVSLPLTVIIPARNEEKRLPPLLQSLQQQNLSGFELIVVDDHSSDLTGRIAAESGARVIMAEEVKDGWIGKSRACWTGAQAASSELLLFLDADTRLDTPDSLLRLVQAYCLNESGGILSVQPFHQVRHLYESLSTVFSIVSMAGMNVFTPLRTRLKSAGAFGPCLMCRRDQYFAVGGHSAVRGAILDDMALAASFRQHDLPLRCFGGRGLIHYRMYPEGFTQLFEGWTKNFGSAAGLTHPAILAMIILWIGGGHSTSIFLGKAIQQREPVWIAAASLCYVVFFLQMLWQSRRIGNFHPLMLLFYPVLHFFFTLTFLWSLVLTKIFHTVKWRGRKINI